MGTYMSCRQMSPKRSDVTAPDRLSAVTKREKQIPSEFRGSNRRESRSILRGSHMPPGDSSRSTGSPDAHRARKRILRTLMDAGSSESGVAPWIARAIKRRSRPDERNCRPWPMSSTCRDAGCRRELRRRVILRLYRRRKFAA